MFAVRFTDGVISSHIASDSSYRCQATGDTNNFNDCQRNIWNMWFGWELCHVGCRFNRLLKTWRVGEFLHVINVRSSTVSLWSRTHWQQSRPYRQQSRPRQAVEFTLLPICCQNRQQGWTCTATVDFQQSRPCWIQLCRQCVFKAVGCRFNRLLKTWRVGEFLHVINMRSSHPFVVRIVALLVGVVTVIHWNACFIHWNACFYLALSDLIGQGSDGWAYSRLHCLLFAVVRSRIQLMFLKITQFASVTVCFAVFRSLAQTRTHR